MSINRYNYEEFFLLYADGELNPLETAMVDQFVQFHPDLKEELDILMDCKLVVDPLVPFHKEKLYKQTLWDAENINEMQTNLLLLIDGELAGGFKKELEKNIAENPVLKQEWNTLQKAKLPVEAIAHPYKKPLYKAREIPALAWLRWAAAAAIIGAAWLLIDKNAGGNKNAGNEVVAKMNNAKKEQTTTNVIQPNTSEAAGAGNNEGNKNSTPNENPSTNNQNTNTITQVKVNNPSPKNINTATKQKPEANTTTDIAQHTATTDSTAIDENNDRALLVSGKVPDNVEDIIKVKPAVAKLSPKIGQLASLSANKPSKNLTDAQAEDDDEYVRIAGARVKKQKIRGIFRGVFRGIGRTFSDSKVEPAVALNNE